jgi:ADP-dependent phosphofructokinase/glucokinase
MAINRTFAEYLKQNAYDYFIFAGYNLLSGEKGLQNALNSVEILKQIKQANPNGIMHLEIASTQDKNIRRLTVEKVTEIIDSIGLNERETLDVCEVLLPEVYNNLKDSKLDCINLFDALLKIKKQTKVSRIQLHIFGLYICLQDKNYKYTPLQTLYGMSGACIAAASKAELGYLQKTEDLTYALREGNGKICFTEIKDLAKHLKLENLLTDGIAEYEGYDLIITPTMLVEKPKTLVGMGDTISSVSLLAGR